MVKSIKYTFDWVLINQLAISKAPQSESNLKILSNAGIKSILSLCTEEEYNKPESMNKLFFCETIDIPDHRKGLLEVKHIESALSKLEYLINNGPTLVHCYAGVERSPLICMAWLIYKMKFKPSFALNYLMQVHKGTSPLNSQIKVLKELKSN